MYCLPYLSIYLSIYLFICLQTYFRRYFSIKQDNNKKYFEEEAEDVHIVAGIMGETVTNQYPISSYTTMEQLHIMIQHTLETFWRLFNRLTIVSLVWRYDVIC